MSDIPEQLRRLDAHDLRNYLDRFVSDNKSCRDVEHRWLASYANDLMVQAYNVKAGNHDTIKAQVNAFRLSEIQEERSKLQDSDLALEEEAITLTMGKAK